MTFKLKDLKELQEHFDDLKDLIVTHYTAGSVEHLHEPRRTQMIFLKATFQKIKEQISIINAQPQAKIKADIDFVNQQKDQLIHAFYGAMLLANEDAHRIKWSFAKEGKMCEKLTEIIGNGEHVAEQDKPSLYKYAMFYTALNDFLLRNLFVGGDSRQGLQEDHILITIPYENLQRLLETGFQLERDAHLKVIEALANNNKTVVNAESFKMVRPTPDSALKDFMPSVEQFEKAQKAATEKAAAAADASAGITPESLAWQNLRSSLRDLIINARSAQDVATIGNLSAVRAPQLLYLKKVEELLLKANKLPDREKVAVLAGAMIHVRQQIIDEYKHSSPTRSLVYRELSLILRMDPETPIDARKIQDVEALLHAANKFVRGMSVVTVALKDQVHDMPKAIAETTPFSAQAIKGFELKKALSLFQTTICTYRIEAVKQVIDAFINGAKAAAAPEKTKAAAAAAASSGWLSGMLGTFGTFGLMPRASSDDEDEVSQEKVPLIAAAAAASSSR